MAESHLGFVLTRLDQIESPVFLHRELEKFPADQLKAVVAEGLLRETSEAEEIPRPDHAPPGGNLIVRRTAKGLFGVADEDDYFDPIPLSSDDVCQFEVSLPKLAAIIRRENDINGTGFENHRGLIPLGQKAIDGLGTVNVYLSFPNVDESVLLLRCRRLDRPSGSQKVVLLTPRGVPLSPEGRRMLDDIGVIVASLMSAAAHGTLTMAWDCIIVRTGIGLAEQYPKDKRVFQKQGRTWLVVYDGIPKSVSDSVGMAYICHLLQYHGQEIHAAAMRSAVTGEEGAPVLGSAGEILDEQALNEYRRRIAEIDEELAEAERNNDLGRIEVLNNERADLYAEVARATGLGGRKREAVDERERARQSVSSAVHRALRSIKKEHDPLWQHLHNSLNIGEFLSYQPDQTATWIT